MAVRPINAIEICAGSGQHGEAVRSVARGARVVVYVEREAAAVALLEARIADGSLDDAPIWDDLRTFDGTAWRGVVDLVFGGFPCQPYSYAGLQRGAEDERDLWDECVRLVRETGCGLAFFENVGGGIREYHRRFRPDLEALGYRVKEHVLKASDIGAPHGRERIFFLAVAHAESDGFGGNARPAPAPGIDSARWRDARGEPGAVRGAGMGDTAGAQRAGDTGCMDDGERWTPPRLGEGGVELGDSDDARLQGRGESIGSRGDELPAWPPSPTDSDAWRRVIASRPDLAPALESPVRGMADGVERGMDLARADRLRILGNGVVPQQAALALRILADELEVEL